MKLAISNIAWPTETEADIAAVMQALQIPGVEIAPTKIWPHPLQATAAEVTAYRQFWQRYNIQIVALQALLYGRADLTIFAGVEKRRETLDYLRGIMELGARLGARILVFGSPKNRLVGTLPLTTAEEIALSFFYNVGEMAAAHGVIFCLEPNPKSYGCDFINTAAEGLALVQRVHSRGFSLHLDAGAMTMNQEPIAETLRQSRPHLSHFHASEPGLAPLGTGGTDHATLAAALRKIAYHRWVSVEMRPNSATDAVTEMQRVGTFLREVYGT